MKKYKRFTKDLFNDEYLIELLENEAKNGWFLKASNNLFLIFKKDDPKVLKYQIDYNKITEEYTEVLNQLGYHFVCGHGYEEKNIYYNEDINAEDLYSDEKTKLISIIYNYRPSLIISSTLTVIATMLMTYLSFERINYAFYPFSLYNFFLNTFEYLFMIFWIFSFVLRLINTIYLIIMYRYYKKQLNQPYSFQPINYKIINIYHIFNAINNIIIFPLIVICLIAEFFELPTILYLDIDIILILIAILIYTHAYKKIILISLIVLIPLSLFSYYSYSLPACQQLYYHNVINKDDINTIDGIFYHSRSTSIYEENYYENNMNVINEEIADILFQGEVIVLDRNYRKNKLIDEYQKIGKNYDEDDYPYLSFDDSLKNMKELKNPLIDQAFYNNNYVICKKNKQVISFQYSSKDQINTIIEYYFK